MSVEHFDAVHAARVGYGHAGTERVRLNGQQAVFPGHFDVISESHRMDVPVGHEVFPVEAEHEIVVRVLTEPQFHTHQDRQLAAGSFYQKIVCTVELVYFGFPCRIVRVIAFRTEMIGQTERGVARFGVFPDNAFRRFARTARGVAAVAVQFGFECHPFHLIFLPGG